MIQGLSCMPDIGLTEQHGKCRMKGRRGMQPRIKKEEIFMKKYECPCGYVYDPEVGDPDSGIAPGTAFEDIPEDWVCPICGLGKDAFTEVE